MWFGFECIRFEVGVNFKKMEVSVSLLYCLLVGCFVILSSPSE